MAPIVLRPMQCERGWLASVPSSLHLQGTNEGQRMPFASTLRYKEALDEFALLHQWIVGPNLALQGLR